MITPKKLRDLWRPARDLTLAGTYYEEFKSLAMNSLKIEGLEYEEETFVKNALIESGQVGFDKTSNKFSMVFGFGLNEYGNPTELTLVFFNGKEYTKRASYDNNENGAYLIQAIPNSYAISRDLKRTADLMAQCDISIRQNLLANRAPLILVARDENIILSIRQAIQQQQNGEPVIIENSLVGDAFNGVDTKVKWLVGDILEFKNLERNKLLNRLGVMTANVAKKERVQSAEVESTIGESVDYLNLMIDTFNKQMDSYGIPYKMTANSAINDIYEATYGTEATNAGNGDIKENDKL